MEPIRVTQTFLPPFEEYEAYLRGIWDRKYLTNNGPLLKEFEAAIKERLKIGNFQFVSNGTIALQLALDTLGIDEGDIITTPFTYVATTSSILWQRCRPVFVDIDAENFCIDASKIEAAITPRTKAIMPVHVFGYPCDVEAIQKVADAHGLKVIYDAAHAFGVEYKGKSLLEYGDVSICSFHATKLFHTIEGGGLVVKDKAIHSKLALKKAFGHDGDDHFMLGINGKASEFQAAMGLCNLKYVDRIIAERKRVCDLYDTLLGHIFKPVSVPKHATRNYAYYPLVLKNETQLKKVMAKLGRHQIFPRRYFFPSLNTLPYLAETQACPVSEDIASRVICLPLHTELSDSDVKRICETLKTAL